jgi:hypothetical protein
MTYEKFMPDLYPIDDFEDVKKYNCIDKCFNEKMCPFVIFGFLKGNNNICYYMCGYGFPKIREEIQKKFPHHLLTKNSQDRQCPQN